MLQQKDTHQVPIRCSHNRSVLRLRKTLLHEVQAGQIPSTRIQWEAGGTAHDESR